MPSVLRELPETKLRIIGSGPYQPDLERLVRKLGLDDCVTIEAIPPTDRRAMAEALVECSLSVLMSEFETHPLAVIEALALGRPALVADTSGLRELAQRGLVRSIPLNSSPEVNSPRRSSTSFAIREPSRASRPRRGRSVRAVSCRSTAPCLLRNQASCRPTRRPSRGEGSRATHDRLTSGSHRRCRDGPRVGVGIAPVAATFSPPCS